MAKITGKKRGSEVASPSVRLALGANIIRTVGDKAFGIASLLKSANIQQRPTGRLATPLKSSEANSAERMSYTLTPSVQLDCGNGQAEREGNEGLCAVPPAERLAYKVNNQGDRTLIEGSGIVNRHLPALLVSYVYLEPFLANKHRYAYRDWVLDSGAYSAYNSGTEIKLQDYIDCCRRLLAEDATLTEVFALDVIGDWKSSLRNVEEMWRQGIPAIPCFHYGSPWGILKGLAKDYPKIALGGCVGKRDKDRFAGQCFARVWPCRVHGFGFGSEKSIMLHPFHSVDATNWELSVCKYGKWKVFGGLHRLSIRGSRQNLRAEVEWYLDLERRARERWKKEMTQLRRIGTVDPASRPPASTVRS